MLKLLCKRFYNKKRYANVSFRPHHRFAVPLPRSRRGGFSFTARQLLAPMRRMRAAAKSRRSVKGYGILASPADAGERSTSANHTSFYSCSWDVFPYDLFPVQLCPMGLLLGQVSKWRAQRADRGAHAARGFVCGATLHGGRHALFTASFNAARGFVCGATHLHDSIWCRANMFQCRMRLCVWCSDGHARRPRGACLVSMPHAALWVVQLFSLVKM